jgi:hypothetical protein
VNAIPLQCELRHLRHGFPVIHLRALDEFTGERAMALKSTRPYFVADIEPTIAVAEAVRWERTAAPPPESRKILSTDLMKEARVARSEYQRELMRRFAGFLVSWLFPRVETAPVKPQSRAVRR